MTHSLKYVLLICAMGMWGPGAALGSGSGSNVLQNSQPSSSSVPFQDLPEPALDRLSNYLNRKDAGRASATAKDYRTAVAAVRSRYAEMGKNAASIDEFLHRALLANLDRITLAEKLQSFVIVPSDERLKTWFVLFLRGCAVQSALERLALLHKLLSSVHKQSGDNNPTIYGVLDFIRTWSAFLKTGRCNCDVVVTEYYLWLAIEKGYTEIVRLFLEKGANTEARNDSGETALHVAIKANCVGSVKLLLKHRANIEATNQYGETSLQRVVTKGHKEVTLLLLQHRANTEARYDSGATILQVAIRAKNIEMTQLLLEYKADANTAFNNAGRTAPLHHMLRAGNAEIAKMLINNGADINARTRYKETSLHLAVKYNHAEVVKLLLERRANAQEINEDGRSPLKLYVKKRNAEVVRLLLEHRADANDEARDEYGDALLKFAIKYNYTEVVKLLLEHRAETESIDSEGRTPLDVANQRQATDSAEALRTHAKNKQPLANVN